MAIVLASGSFGLGQQPLDPSDVLRRTRERLLDDLARLPRYTCVQTITRRYFAAPPASSHSCTALIHAHDDRTVELHSTGWDRMRLEVAIAEGQNVYSWVGAAKFEEGNLEQLAGRGPLGSGDFGTFLEAILERGSIDFKEEGVVNGRRVLEYSYEMPLNRSGYRVKANAEWVPTAYSGRLVLDPQTMDALSLTVRSAELPTGNPACQANSEIEYQRTSIHDRMILVPRETRLNTISRDGSEAVGETTYEHCREYSSHSRMLAAPSAEATTGPPASTATPTSPLSPDLTFNCRIITRINSDTASAGDPIEAVLTSPINDKKAGWQIPVGARMHGRLTRFEHRLGNNDSFRIAVQWESIEVNGQHVPLRAVPEPPGRSGFAIIPIFVLADEVSPGGRILVFRRAHLQLDKFDWRWTTLAPATPEKDDSEDSPARSSAPKPHEVEIADTEFNIDVSGIVRIKAPVPAGATDVHLEGTFKTVNSDGEVAVFLFSNDEFVRWQNQNPASSLYESGRTQSGTIDVALPSQADTYSVVFSNHFPNSPAQAVQVTLHLRYMLGGQN